MVHVYNGVLVIKKNKVMPFTVAWMDLEIVVMSEVSHTHEDKYCMMPLICRILKKKRVQMNLFTTQK